MKALLDSVDRGERDAVLILVAVLLVVYAVSERRRA